MAYHLQAAVPRIIGHSASGADCDQWFYHPGSFSLPRSLVDGTITTQLITQPVTFWVAVDSAEEKGWGEYTLTVTAQ